MMMEFNQLENDKERPGDGQDVRDAAGRGGSAPSFVGGPQRGRFQERPAQAHARADARTRVTQRPH